MPRYVLIPAYVQFRSCYSRGSQYYEDEHETEMILVDLASVSSARIVGIKTKDVEYRDFWKEAVELRMRNGDTILLDCSLGHIQQLLGAEAAIEKEE